MCPISGGYVFINPPATEAFRTDPSPTGMMQYLINAILMRRRAVQRTTNIWDSSIYSNLQHVQHEDGAQRQSRARSRTQDTTGYVSDASTRTPRVARSNSSARRSRPVSSTPCSSSSESRRGWNTSLESTQDTPPGRRFCANARQRQTQSLSWQTPQPNHGEDDTDEEEGASEPEENQPLSQALPSPVKASTMHKRNRVGTWVTSCTTQQQSDGSDDDTQKKTKKNKRSQKKLDDTVEVSVPAQKTKRKSHATDTEEVPRLESNKKSNKRKKAASFLEELAADHDAVVKECAAAKRK